jgi:hypothetical protein
MGGGKRGGGEAEVSVDGRWSVACWEGEGEGEGERGRW